MKVVINKCFGGFGISRTAMLSLLKRGCEHVQINDPATYYGREKDWRSNHKRDLERAAEHPSWAWIVFTDDGKPLTEEHKYNDGSRACPHLVAVVEEMGSEAYGGHAELHVVEIPDGVAFMVEEYDGMEHIAEAHRKWS